jgi:hypothetical protein
MPLYKYRGVTNLERTLQILIDAQLYAAQFVELNDPMEGTYQYDTKILTPEKRKIIMTEKLKYRLVSLSETYQSTLMWSYYSEGHRGIVIGVEVTDKDLVTDVIRYVEQPFTASDDYTDAHAILLQKFDIWKHEHEQRVFAAQEQCFVPIKITDIILGVESSPTIEKIVKAVAKEYCPTVEVRRLDKDELEGPVKRQRSGGA